jgi:hypothetical protein
MTPLERIDDGWHVGLAVLGETRCEKFSVCADKNIKELRFCPVAPNASAKIWIEGPAPAYGTSYHWMIDGRDEEVPAGTVYEIAFRWGKKRNQIKWSEVNPALGAEIENFIHRYSVFGSSTSYNSFLDMTESPDRRGVYEVCIRIGLNGEESFQIVRDHDTTQAIYPDRGGTSLQPSIPVRGPDDLGVGKYWKLTGKVDEYVKIRLEVDDGEVKLAVSCDSFAASSESMAGWARHSYFVRATWSEDILPLKMDEDRPGVFTCTGICSGYSEESEEYVERFQILIDGDVKNCFFPMATDADSGRYITLGPTGNASDNTWLVRAPFEGESFEIVLDLTTPDKRKTVTWRWTQVSTLEEQLAYFEQLAVMDE